MGKKLNEKTSINSNIKKKPLVSIRNTVINFNMIDSGLLLASLKRKKNGKKNYFNYASNNSVNKINILQNNHLFGLCNKFNSNITLNSNNNRQILSNMNKFDNNNYIKLTKTISNNNKQIYRYGDKSGYNFGKKYKNNNDKGQGHIKYNSMRLEDYYGLKKKKNLKNINTNKIDNTINSNNGNKKMNIDYNHFNTINN